MATESHISSGLRGFLSLPGSCGGRSTFPKPVPSDFPDTSRHADQPVDDPCPPSTAVSQPETSTTLDLRNGLSINTPPPANLPPLHPPPPAPASVPAPVSPDLPPPSPPSPPLPDMSPKRPTTLALKTLPRPSTVKENGGPPQGVNEEEEERKGMEEDLKKCIEDFRKIKVPKVFPDKKRHWQSDLLKKYDA
ncbi:uncharacterized protein ACWYII_024853 [Salvelinus alpinus]